MTHNLGVLDLAHFIFEDEEIIAGYVHQVEMVVLMLLLCMAIYAESVMNAQDTGASLHDLIHSHLEDIL